MRSACLVVALWLAFAGAHAQGTGGERDCSHWVAKKGFSIDCIQLRTGKRQRGMADAWRGNVEAKDVQPGDVVMTSIRDKGRRLHASYVEEVRRNADGSVAAAVVTDWNRLGKYVDEPCLVTDHFGRDSGPPPVPVEASCASGGRACRSREPRPSDAPSGRCPGSDGCS